jgi:hypothetical protein
MPICNVPDESLTGTTHHNVWRQQHSGALSNIGVHI